MLTALVSNTKLPTTWQQLLQKTNQNSWRTWMTLLKTTIKYCIPSKRITSAWKSFWLHLLRQVLLINQYYRGSNIRKSMFKRCNPLRQPLPLPRKSLLDKRLAPYRGRQSKLLPKYLYGRLRAWKSRLISTTWTHTLVREVSGMCTKVDGKERYIRLHFSVVLCLRYGIGGRCQRNVHWGCSKYRSQRSQGKIFSVCYNANNPSGYLRKYTTK